VAPHLELGCHPKPSDTELVCLTVAQVLFGYFSARRCWRPASSTPWRSPAVAV
jgi:hypothetical protein